MKPGAVSPLGSAGQPKAASAGAPTSFRLKLLLVAVSVLIVAGLGETSLRLFYRKQLRIPLDERTLLHRYHETLGWFPIPNSHARLVASRPFSVVHNSEGFRAPERIESNRPGILFVGDSFVWGFDVEAAERFTDKLQARHPEVSVYNIGVSGYGTDQEYLLLQRVIDSYKPQVVVLVFTENDNDDNSSNCRYHGYYKPFYTVENGQARLHGVPVPWSERVYLSEHPRIARSYLARLLARAWFKVAAPRVLENPNPTTALIREMQKLVISKGAVFAVGLTARQPALEQFLDGLGVAHMDLTTPLRFPYYGEHWTPEGHTVVCDRMEAFLSRGSGAREGSKSEIRIPKSETNSKSE